MQIIIQINLGLQVFWAIFLLVQNETSFFTMNKENQ